MRHPYGALAYAFYGLAAIFAVWRAYKFIPTAQQIIREASEAQGATVGAYAPEGGEF